MWFDSFLLSVVCVWIGENENTPTLKNENNHDTQSCIVDEKVSLKKKIFAAERQVLADTLKVQVGTDALTSMLLMKIDCL